MPVNQVSVCNDGLVMVGAERISSITQDRKSARLLNAIWDSSRDAVLRARKWNFATKRVVLTPNSTVPNWGFDYQYDLPSDYLGWLQPDPDDIEFTIEAGKILSNESELNVSYVYRNVDESSWDSAFAKSLSCFLAKEICIALTQSVSLKQSCDADYKASLGAASFANSVEKTLTGIESTSWTDARRR